MKLLPLSLLILSMALSGCQFVNVDLLVMGKIGTPNGDPSVGIQGQLCIKATTPDTKDHFFCQSLITDENGEYQFNLHRQMMQRLNADPMIVTYEVSLITGFNRYVIKNIDPTTIDHNQPIVLNFINQDGYNFGKGARLQKESNEIQQVIYLSEKITDETIYTAITALEKLAYDSLDQLNPTEILNIELSMYLLTSNLKDISKTINSRVLQDKLFVNYVKKNSHKIRKEVVKEFSNRSNFASTKDYLLKYDLSPN